MFLNTTRCFGSRVKTLFSILVILGFLYVLLAPVSYPRVAERSEVNSYNISHDAMNTTDQLSEEIVSNRPISKPKQAKASKTTKKLKGKDNMTMPSEIKKKLNEITVHASLVTYSEVLYNRAKRAISYIQIPPAPKKVKEKAKPTQIKRLSLGYPDYVHNPNLTICSSKQHSETKLILFTSMFHSASKQYLFNNTLTNYANLLPVVQPVLFICDMDTIDHSGYLVMRACNLGWAVYACPRRTQYGYPILNSMFFHCMYTYKQVQWMSYANADILFSSQLTTVLEFVDTTPSFANITFMSSLRTNVYLDIGEQLSTLSDVDSLVLRNDSKLHKSGAIDYFIYRRSSPMFSSMPNYCTGRRGFDNWLVYFYLRKKLPSLDLSGAMPVLHIAIRGVSFKVNSHAFVKNESDYNMYLSTGEYWIGAGELRCMSYSLKHVDSLNATEYVWLNRTVYKELSKLSNEEQFNFTKYEMEPYAKRSQLMESFKGHKKVIPMSAGKSKQRTSKPVFKSYQEYLVAAKKSAAVNKTATLKHNSSRTPTKMLNDSAIGSHALPTNQTNAVAVNTPIRMAGSREVPSLQVGRRLSENQTYFEFTEYRKFNFNPPKPKLSNDTKLTNQTRNSTKSVIPPPGRTKFLFNLKGENILKIYDDGVNGSYIVHSHSEYSCPVKFGRNAQGLEKLVLNLKPKPESGCSDIKPSLISIFVVCLLCSLRHYIEFYI